MVHFGFFCSSIAARNPPGFLFGTCLTFLLNIFWTIHQEQFFCQFWKKFAELKKELRWSSSGKVVGLQHPDLLKWNSQISVLLGVTNIIFWGIFRSSYYMESLQMIDKFCSSHLMIFLNMAYISSQRSYKKPKGIKSSLHLLSPRLSYAVCVYLTFVPQGSNILYSS